MPFPHPDECALRPARDDDSPGIVALVGCCFSAYPGCLLDVNDEERGLLTPSTSFAAFWVLAHHDRILATIACTEHDVDGQRGPEPGVELKKCYVHPALRGHGVARRLVDLVEDHARSAGRQIVELWSDTRFVTAHGVYTHLGYRPTGAERALEDSSATREFHFVKRLAPLQR